MPKNRLFSIPGSHPAIAAQLMLDRKGVDYKRLDLLPIISKGVLRAAGFPGNTVPAVKIEGEKIQGTGDIARALDRLYPDDPIVPTADSRRATVEQIANWGDEELQGVARRMLWWAMRRDKNRAIGTFAEGARIGVPIAVAERTAWPIIYLAGRFNGATDEQVKADLASLPEIFERIKGMIASGELDPESPTLADYQVGTSLRLMSTLEDLRPAMDRSGMSAYAVAVAPDYPGAVGPVFPAEWLEPLRA